MNPLHSGSKSSRPRVEPSTESGLTSKNGTCPATSPSKARGHSRITEADLLELAYGIPSLHACQASPSSPSSNSGSSNVHPYSKHSRSMSHPFPSLFQSKPKRQGPNALSTSDLFHSDNHTQSTESTSRTATKSIGTSEKILVTGKCMTCDSTVRWPKELLVFRCTVCLTINDLKPVSASAPERDIQGPQTSGKRSAREIFPPFTRTKPLSTLRTRALIEQCIDGYLLNRFGAECREAQVRNEPDCGLEMPHAKQSISLSLPTGIDRQSLKPEQGNSFRGVVNDSDKYLRFNRDDDEPDESFDLFSSPQTNKQNTDTEFTQSESRNLKHNRVWTSAKNIRTATKGIKDVFKPLEDYIIMSFVSRECINNSFTVPLPLVAPHAASEGIRKVGSIASDNRQYLGSPKLSDIDAKTLLIGNIAENGAWWTGERDSLKNPETRRPPQKSVSMRTPNQETAVVSLKSPRIDWTEANNWYDHVLQFGTSWKPYLQGLMESGRIKVKVEELSSEEMTEIDRHILEAQAHTRRVLLKATESLLKRPGTPLRQPDDVRFLLIILENPLLYPSCMSFSRGHTCISKQGLEELWPSNTSASLRKEYLPSLGSFRDHETSSGQHSGIIKRVLGLLSNLTNDCHHHLVAWFARYSETHFRKTTELVGSFVTYRLSRQQGKQQITKKDSDADLIPDASTAGRGASAALHITLNSGHRYRKSKNRPRPEYNDDWQIRAAARVMALLFTANNQPKGDVKVLSGASTSNSNSLPKRTNPNYHGDRGQRLAISSFYNTLLDYSDLVADFEAWELGRGKFSFCQYPFFLSIWAKIQIMEHDARRQMEVKAREAFFDSIMTRKTVNQYLVLRIRRECLVEDSLKGVSEVVGSVGEEIKKGLRIEFKGEEGIDAGGLRKEWFLLLVRDLFNPDHGMFVYDEDSHFCYFNPNSFETSDQYFLVGVVLGLAIYNSTILDVALPPFAFRKLLAAGPTAAPGAPSHAKPNMNYRLEDLAELRPALANGLLQLLEFDGDVEETFCRDFVAEVERYGQVTQIPLCPNGGEISVTNGNRHEFVDLYVRYLLDTAVSRQFEPLKRGFFTICGGNALSLFRPEEIELLIRGSDESLDIGSLQAVAIYENWGVPNAAETEPLISWFWYTFQGASPKDQRKLLGFITGSDRIPAMGAASLVIKLSCLGNDSRRFPIARTCFNSLSLWRYNSRQKLESMLWRAVYESEGFGLK